MKLNIKNINIIQDDIEKYILIKITKTFGQILDNELINIQSKVYNKFNKK